MKPILLLIAFVVSFGAFAQKTERVFLTKGDSSRNYYMVVYPTTKSYKGYLFLIPGFGETPEWVMQQTDIPTQAAKKGIMTIIPVFQDGVLSIGIDKESQATLNKMIADVVKKQKLKKQKFFVGGFSIGGSAAIKLAEDLKVKPEAVFAIDPPLDFERFYNAAYRDIRLSGDEREPSQENVYMVKRIKEMMGGEPEKELTTYYKTSPYSYTDTEQRAVKKMGNTPIRIYSEPDVNWWMRERKADLYNMNTTDCAAFINELQQLGNKQAELIITQDKGYRRPNKTRHPHSWSIADADKVVQWLLNR